MKRIISVLCILSLVASFSCIAVAGTEPVVAFSLDVKSPAEGETEFTVDVVASLPEGGDVTQLGIEITIPAGITLKGCEKVITFGSFETSENFIIDPFYILWVSGTESLPVGDTVIARLTVAYPSSLVGDVTYDFGIALDPENLPASVAGIEYSADDVALSDGSITVKGKPVETTTTATKTEPTGTREPIYRPIYTGPHTTAVVVTDEIGNVVTDTDGNPLTEMVEVTEGQWTTRYDVVEVTKENGEVVTDADGNPVTEIVIVTDAPAADTNTGAVVGGNSATTGDNVFVVVSVLVAALGCALIVRKVNL